jgi:hypothetical protein
MYAPDTADQISSSFDAAEQRGSAIVLARDLLGPGLR